MNRDDVDYAVPASVASSRRREPRVRGAGADGDVLWGGPARTWLRLGCAVAALVLALPLVVPLLRGEATGAASPEAAVALLLQGIADTDPVALVAAIDPVETDEPGRADTAYGRLSTRLLRQGEDVPPDVTAVLAAAEQQIDGSFDLTAVATLAALDLDLDGLDLRVEPDRVLPDSRARVYLEDGDLAVTLDPDRLPGSVSGLGRAAYTMPLAEGWRRDRGAVPVEPFLVVVERDGRWYVSLEATSAALVPVRPPGGRGTDG